MISRHADNYTVVSAPPDQAQRQKNMFSRLLKTKTFWTAVGSIASGAILCAAQDYAQGVPLIIAGLMAIFVRDAIAKLPDALAPKR